MTYDELKAKFPHASEQFLRANAGDSAHRGKAPSAELERCLTDEPLAADALKARHSGKFFVRVVSFRRRLLDEDNLCEKFHVDCVRYAAIIPSDAPGRCRIVTTQEKVRSKEEERTEILIEQIRGG